jgi:hypothetical protein
MNWYRVVIQDRVAVVCASCAHDFKMTVLGEVFERAQTCAKCNTK